MTENDTLHTLAQFVSGGRKVGDRELRMWEQLADLAERHGLSPMLYWTARAQGVPLITDSGRQGLAESAMHWALLEWAMRDILTALNDAQLPALWLKGIPLAQTVYPDPILRPMGDLDVLVPFDQREHALKIVQSLGYDYYAVEHGLFESTGNSLKQQLSYHYQLRGGPAARVFLELHYRLLSHDDSLLSLDQIAWFWSQRIPVLRHDGSVFETLAPVAHLLYLCAHALIQHKHDDFRLLRYLDIHLLIQHSEIVWTVVTERAIALGWAPAVEEALRTCVDYFATEVPDDVLHALSQFRSAPSVARVERMAGAGTRWERVRANLRALSFREAVAYAAQIVFPRPSYMRSRYRVAPGTSVWPYYLRRLVDQGREVAASTWKRLTGRYR